VASKLAEYKLNKLSCVGAMLEAYRKLKTKPKTIAELKETLPGHIWGNLPQSCGRLLKVSD